MQQHNSFHRIINELGWTTSSTIFLVVAGLLLNVLLGNLFNEDGLGLYSMTTTLYLTMGTVASVGLPGALTKYSAEFTDETDTEQEFFTAGLSLATIFGLLGSVIILILRGWLADIFGMPGLENLLIIVACGIPLFELNKIILARLRGLRQIRSFAIGESTRYLLLILLTLGLVIWFRNLAAAVWALVLVELFLFIGLWQVTKLKQYLRRQNLIQRSRQLSRFGSQVLLARLIVDLDARLDLFLVGYFLTQADVGIYTVAIMFAQGLKILPTAFQKVTGPIITQTYTRHDIPALEQFINRTMQVMVFLLTILSIPLVVLFPQIVQLLYPGQDAFLEAQAAFNVLVIGFLFRGVVGSIGNVYVSIGRPDITFKVAPIRLVINFTISVALVGLFGISGIAAGAAAAAVAVFILWTGLMPRVVGIQVDYKPLLTIPVLGGITILVTYIFSITLPLVVSLAISLSIFGLVAIKVWHFEQYLIRLWRLTPKIG